jgi:hypothetical protein
VSIEIKPRLVNESIEKIVEIFKKITSGVENIQRNALYSTHPCKSYIVDRCHLVSMCCHNHYESYMYLVVHHLQMQILNNVERKQVQQRTRK